MRGRTAKLRFAIRLLATSTAVLAAPTLPVLAQKAAPAKPAPPAKPAAAPAHGATPATVLDDKEVESILGREIYSPTGEDMGKIVDILVDHTGQVRAAIIDFGGFLGVGTRKIAVDWRAIRFAPPGDSGHVFLSLTRNEVRVAPEYKPDEPVVVLGPSAAPSAPPANASAAPPKTPAPPK